VCAIDSSGNNNCQTYLAVNRQFSYNTDANAPAEPAGPDARHFTEWFMTFEPEQDKYTAYLTVNFADPTRPEEECAFVPSLRRYQSIATGDALRVKGWTRPSRIFTMGSIRT